VTVAEKSGQFTADETGKGQFTADETGKGQFFRGNRRSCEKDFVSKKSSGCA